MIIEISVAIAAVAFLLLVVYLILLIKAVKNTLSQVDASLADMRQHANEIGQDAKKAAFDFNYKLQSFNSIFQSISNVGEFLKQKSKGIQLDAEAAAFKNEALKAEKPAKNFYVNPVLDQLANIFELVGQSFRLWQNVHKRR